MINFQASYGLCKLERKMFVMIIIYKTFYFRHLLYNNLIQLYFFNNYTILSSLNIEKNYIMLIFFFSRAFPRGIRREAWMSPYKFFRRLFRKLGTSNSQFLRVIYVCTCCGFINRSRLTAGNYRFHDKRWKRVHVGVALRGVCRIFSVLAGRERPELKPSAQNGGWNAVLYLGFALV